MATDGKEITLVLPADGDYTLLARLLISGLGMLSGLDVDQIDDLRTAANECCYCLLHQPVCLEHIEITATIDGKELQCRFGAVRGVAETGEPQPDLAVTRGILQTLLPKLTLHSDAQGVDFMEFSLALSNVEDV